MHKANWCKGALLFIFTFICYAPSLKAPFFYDDFPTIVHNAALHGSSYFSLIGKGRWLFLCFIKFLTEWGGIHPLLLRIVSVFIHLGAGFMAYLLALRLFKQDTASTPYAFLSTALFLLHPLQTQTICHITQAFLEAGVTLWMMAAFLCAFLYEEKQNNFYIFLFVGCAIAGGAWKEVSCVLPLLLASAWWCRLLSLKWAFMAAGCMWPMAFMYSPGLQSSLLLTPLSVNRGALPSPASHVAWYNYFILQPEAWWHYFSLIWWPFSMRWEYAWPLPQKISLKFFICFFSALFLLFSSFFMLLRLRYFSLLFCLCWTTLFIGARASIIPSTEFVCDYKCYGAFWGVSVILSWAAYFLWEQSCSHQEVRRQFAFWGTAIFLLTTLHRNFVWSCPGEIWKECIEKGSFNPRIANNYASFLADLGENTQALFYLEKACALDPFYVQPLINKGMIQARMGNKKAAEVDFEKAFSLLKEPCPELFHAYAAILKEKGDKEKAKVFFQEAILQRPWSSASWYELAHICVEQKEYNRAVYCFEKVAALSFPFREKDVALFAYCLVKENQTLKALSILESSVEAFHSSLYKQVKALCLYACKQRDKAQLELLCAASLPSDPEDKHLIEEIELTLGGGNYGIIT